MKVYVIYSSREDKPIRKIYKTKDAAIRDQTDYLIDSGCQEVLARDQAEFYIFEHEVLEDY